jgi:flagellar basal body rod protein FlgB
MIRALYTAASGMRAQQANIDNVAHNLANVNTAGFKKAHLEFEDLVYQETRTPGSPAHRRRHPGRARDGAGHPRHRLVARLLVREACAPPAVPSTSLSRATASSR